MCGVLQWLKGPFFRCALLGSLTPNCARKALLTNFLAKKCHYMIMIINQKRGSIHKWSELGFYGPQSAFV